MTSRYRMVLAIGLLCGSTLACTGKSTGTKESFLKSADDYAAQGKYAEAIIEYRNAIQLDNKFGPAHARLGDAYLKTRDLPQAVRELVLAADLQPENADAQVRAGQFLLIAGQFQDAMARADRALEKQPNHLSAQILKGNAAGGLKDIDGAIDDINEAIRMDPTEARSFATLGAMEMALGKRTDAERAFKQAVKLQPDSVPALLALSNFYWAAGRLADSGPVLEHAVQMKPDNILAQRALAMYYMMAGKTAEAEGPYKAIARIAKDQNSRLALADYYTATKRTPEAIALLKQIAATPGGFADATVRLGGVDYMEGRVPQAVNEIDSVLSREPKNTPALLLKTRIFLGERKGDEALSAARAAVAADPRSAMAHYMLGVASQNLDDLAGALAAFTDAEKLNPRLPNVHSHLAELNLVKGAGTAAVQFAEDAVRGAPKDATNRLVLARTLISTAQLGRAEGILKELVAQYPNAAPIQAQLGVLYLAKNEPAAARRALDRALEIEPLSLFALGGRLSVDLAVGDTRHATALVDKRLAGAAKSVPLLLMAANVYSASGDLVKQEWALNKVIELDPKNLTAFSDLGALFVRQRKLGEAITRYQAMLAADAKSVMAGTMLGVIYEAQGKPAEAQKAYEKVVAATPTAALAANNLAWMYAEHGGNLDVALQLVQSAKAQLPDAAQVNDTLGWVYYKKDLAGPAITAFQAAVKAEPRDATFHYHLGLAYDKSKDLVKARAEYDQALKLKPNFPEAAAARKAK